MNRLLNANFTRLKKSKTFWGLAIVTIAYAIVLITTEYRDMKKFGYIVELSNLIFNYPVLIGLAISLFASLFVGTEYSDGGLRNKISVGHKRIDIYLSNFFITVVTSLLFYVLFLVVILAIGLPLFGPGTLKLSTVLALLGCALFVILAYSSIFTLLAMTISNKVITTVTNLLLAFALVFTALMHQSILSESEYITMAQIDETKPGEIDYIQMPNPRYPSESTRKMFQTLLDINPAGQALQIYGSSAANLIILPIYSCLLMIITTSFGLFIFAKKELN